MNKYLSRLTSSARGEVFNFLLWPFLFATFIYGVGFAFILPFTNAFGTSSLFVSMASLGIYIPIVWGGLAVFTIVGGLTFLLFNIPPFGKLSGLAGASLWFFAAACYIATGDWLVLFSVAVPNMAFWVWQYFSLSKFRHQDAADKRTMEQYDHGDFDAL